MTQLVATGIISQIEPIMAEMPQAECPVSHMFSKGLYIRELCMKAGTFAIGHHQRFEHLNVFLKGKVRVLNDDGTTTDLCSPMTFTGKPGRKCGYVLEDVVWQNIYPTTETDIETLEQTYLDKSLSVPVDQQLIQHDVTEDQEDYRTVLSEYGFTEETVRDQSEDETDQVPFPPAAYKIRVADSHLEGKGIFATGNIEKGEFICVTRLGDKRTPAGRYTNHSKNPNAIMVQANDDIILLALRDIAGCTGGQIGEEITTDYRNNLALIGGAKCQE